jgi:hypothetical protein
MEDTSAVVQLSCTCSTFLPLQGRGDPQAAAKCMWTLLDLMDSNEEAIRGEVVRSLSVLVHACEQLEFLKPEHGDHELIEAVTKMKAHLTAMAAVASRRYARLLD